MLQNVSPSHPTQRTSQRRHTVQPTRSGPLLPSSYKPPTHPLARSASLASLCWQKVLGPLPAGLMALADSQHPPQIATAAPSLIIHSNLQPITENSLATPLKVTPHPPTSPKPPPPPPACGPSTWQHPGWRAPHRAVRQGPRAGPAPPSSRPTAEVCEQ